MFGYSAKIIIAAVVGAIVLWTMESDINRDRYGLGRLTGRIPNNLLRESIQMIIFLGLGTYISILLAAPSTPNQAFAAGLGWTAGVSGVSGRISRSSVQSKSKEKNLPKAKNASAGK